MKLYNDGQLIDIEEVDFDSMVASYYVGYGISDEAGLVNKKVELWDLFPCNENEAIQLKTKLNDIETCEDKNSEDDVVNNPKHYQIGLGKYEMKDVSYALIDHNKLSGREGAVYFNVLKYIGRFNNKGVPVQDLEKAEFYLKELIELTKEKDY